MPWFYGLKVWGLFAGSDGFTSVLLAGTNIPNGLGWYAIRADNAIGMTNIYIACSKARASDSYVDVELDGWNQVITIYEW